MIYVKHFKSDRVYLIYSVKDDYVYYEAYGKIYKRHIAQFLSKDSRSETGNKLDFSAFAGFRKILVRRGRENAIDATDYDESGKMKQDGLNVELARVLLKYY